MYNDQEIREKRDQLKQRKLNLVEKADKLGDKIEAFVRERYPEIPYKGSWRSEVDIDTYDNVHLEINLDISDVKAFEGRVETYRSLVTMWESEDGITRWKLPSLTFTSQSLTQAAEEIDSLFLPAVDALFDAFDNFRQEFKEVHTELEQVQDEIYNFNREVERQEKNNYAALKNRAKALIDSGIPLAYANSFNKELRPDAAKLIREGTYTLDQLLPDATWKFTLESYDRTYLTVVTSNGRRRKTRKEFYEEFAAGYYVVYDTSMMREWEEHNADILAEARAAQAEKEAQASVED
jgi:DNA repair exonuclease SbcCD ATPase subunit